MQQTALLLHRHVLSSSTKYWTKATNNKLRRNQTLTRCNNCFDEYVLALGVCPSCGYVPGMPAEEAIHMDPGSVLHARYTIGKVLGFGGFGVTYLA